MKAQEIIQLLNLVPLPHEGGFFRQTYIADESIGAESLPERYGRSLPFSTAIYYLMTPDHFSAMHRLQTDEIFHFYVGDPVEMLLLKPDGRGEPFTLGTNLASGMRPQKLVPRGVWQGTVVQPNGRYGYALIGTTMAPAYDQASFELGEMETLIEQYPSFKREIQKRVR